MPISPERYDSLSGSPERIRDSPTEILTAAGKTTSCTIGHADLPDLNRRYSRLVLYVDPTAPKTTHSPPGKPGGLSSRGNPSGEL